MTCTLTDEQIGNFLFVAENWILLAQSDQKDIEKDACAEHAANALLVYLSVRDPERLRTLLADFNPDGATGGD